MKHELIKLTFILSYLIFSIPVLANDAHKINSLLFQTGGFSFNPNGSVVVDINNWGINSKGDYVRYKYKTGYPNSSIPNTIILKKDGKRVVEVGQAAATGAGDSFFTLDKNGNVTSHTNCSTTWCTTLNATICNELVKALKAADIEEAIQKSFACTDASFKMYSITKKSIDQLEKENLKKMKTMFGRDIAVSETSMDIAKRSSGTRLTNLLSACERIDFKDANEIDATKPGNGKITDPATSVQN